jgi:hypothetical protein
MAKSKRIRLTAHAREQMELRGAAMAEVAEVIHRGDWQLAKRGKYHARHHFPFGKASPVNKRTYAFKTVEAIFVEEMQEIVIITVKVYYSNEEQTK